MLRNKLFDGLKRISTPFRMSPHHRDGIRQRRGSRRPRLECLERRELLSVDGWSIAMGSEADREWGWDTAADAGGNVYVTGQFDGTVDFDPDPGGVTNLTSQGNGDAFVAKYDPTGALLWATSAGTAAGNDEGRAIAIDGSGNAYVVGVGSSRFWKLDSDGNTVWSGAPDANSLLSATDVAVDGSGDIYLSGSFSDTVDLGKPGSSQTISLTSAGPSDIYVAKYSPDGEVVWAQRAGSSTGTDGARGMAVDEQNNIYVTGFSRDGADFGGESVSLPRAKKGGPKNTSPFVFVAKMDAADGTFLWTKAAGGLEPDLARDVAVDGSGNVYITGLFWSSSATFGDHTIHNSASLYYDIYAAKLDPAGTFLWASGFGGYGSNTAYSIIADDAGSVYLAGTNQDEATFGPFELPGNPAISSGYGGFLAKLDASSGDVLSAQEITWDVGGLSIGGDGAVNFTGGLKTDVSGDQFPTGETLISTPQTDGSPSSDIYVSKMRPGAPGIRRLSVSPDPVTQGDALTLSADGVLDIAGRVASVAFYRDANADGLLDAGDELLGTDSNVSDAWSVDTTGLAIGTHTLFAVATDNDGLTSDAVSATGTVVDQPQTSANDIYVADLQFESRLRGKNGSKRDDRVVLTVRNDADANGADSGDPVLGGVAVTVEVSRWGSPLVTLSGTTNNSGVFTSRWLSNLAIGDYTATVMDISLDGFIWNASLGTNIVEYTIGQSSAASADALLELEASTSRAKKGAHDLVLGQFSLSDLLLDDAAAAVG